MNRLFGVGIATVLGVALGSCGTTPTGENAGLSVLVGGTSRPVKGNCTIVVTARIHDEGEEEGGCGGCGGGGTGEEGGCEDGSGGPPIPRHYELIGRCQLTHLGLVTVTGRMNLTGPFGAHGEEQAELPHGRLAVRGRLGFEAADGDLVGGSYTPVEATFTRESGRVVFTSTQVIGASCSDLGGGGGEEDHDEPVLSGRFVGATGRVSLMGNLQVSNQTRTGVGTLVLSGTISY